MTQTPVPVPVPSTPPLSNTARRVHEHFFALQMSAVFLSAQGPLEPEVYRQATEAIFKEASRLALTFDQLVYRTPSIRPPAPPPQALQGKNADGTPFVWERPSKQLVEALRLLRSLAEEPPTTVQEIAERIAPVQEFLKAFDEAQPRV